MKFMLEIELGNEAMQNGCQLGELLKMNGVRFMQGEDGPDVRDSGKLRDTNGNTVGKWELK
jgi:hypothetical protein